MIAKKGIVDVTAPKLPVMHPRDKAINSTIHKNEIPAIVDQFLEDDLKINNRINI